MWQAGLSFGKILFVSFFDVDNSTFYWIVFSEQLTHNSITLEEKIILRLYWYIYKVKQKLIV